MTLVLKNSWALLLGMFLLMLGNGVQGTLLGIRGALEGFTPGTMSLIMSGYFVGFLGGSQMAPGMIRRVGHVRVFAALASMISAALILYAAMPNEFVWFFLRVVVGFCFSGVYVVAESWLNDSATNETRGQALSAYLIVQMMGIVAAQWLLNFADVGGFILFIIISVAVSVSFAPILLSVSPAPVFHTTKPMSLKELFHASPLGVVGTFLLGGIFAALFGMTAVYGTEKGMSVGEISIFVGIIYVGGMLCQFPIGWLSDRMDRRLLIIGITMIGTATTLVAFAFASDFTVLMVCSFIIGGTANPLYSLLLAYTNDFLELDDMAAASGGLIFVNGIGAISGPLVVGWMMSTFGSDSFFLYIGALMMVMAIYAIYRTFQRASPDVDDTNSYAPVFSTASPVAFEVAQEVAIEMALEGEEGNDSVNSL
ncbi:MFS transporter [Neptunicoccus sediminis]|uniref:MFS transporter n=1 Tax=Neptunicoccus sediminis TaxID=1892596 RepID=UPI0008461EDE|nr:MFS transporter [Neptunicoccus sediminis]